MVLGLSMVFTMVSGNSKVFLGVFLVSFYGFFNHVFYYGFRFF